MEMQRKQQIPINRWAVVVAIVILTLATVMLTLASGVWAGQTDGDNNFVAYPDNPVLELGNPGEWDGGTIILPETLVVSDTYYLFYTGIMTAFNSPAAIGYATSPNGLTWTKQATNPILTGDGTGFDAYMVADPAIILSDGLWTMYYAGKPAPPLTPNDLQVGRATAPDPSGPWTRDPNPVLTLGSPGEWDSGFVEPSTILQTADGFVMYYSGGVDYFLGGFMVGMATSPDGITWTKQDDPTTVDPPFAESDPVLMQGAMGAWDDGFVWEGQVYQTPCGWEMYYSGGDSVFGFSSIGYATSVDGIHWVKDSTNPIYEASDDPVTMGTGDVVEIPSVIVVGDERWMYYDYGQGTAPPAVGLAKASLACWPVYLPLTSRP